MGGDHDVEEDNGEDDHHHDVGEDNGDRHDVGEDEGDHRLVILLLDGNDGPGVGDYGEEADWQGEDQEGRVKHLVAQNSRFHIKFVFEAQILKGQPYH